MSTDASHTDPTPTPRRAPRPGAGPDSAARPAPAAYAGDTAFTPVARSAADVLAIMPHTLAMWPRRSAVMLTAASTEPGPCLRVDLPEPGLLSDETALLEWIVELSELLELDALGDRLYLALFVEGSRLSAHEIERVMEAVGEAGALSGHAMAGAWEVGAEQWADLEEPEPRAGHSLEEIRTSALWTAMVVSGSTVEERRPELLARDREMEPAGEADLRVEDCRALVRELERRTGPRAPARPASAGIRAWEAVLSDGAGGAALAAARLDASALADLLGVVMDPVGSDALAAAVLTADPAAAVRAWEQATDPLGGPAADAQLHWMADVMTGQWDGHPEWGRAAVFESVLEVLLDLLHGVPVGESDTECLREAEASLWVATAHLERFRARGTWACQWLQLAEEAAPGHTGAARARMLGARCPVPRWAGDPRRAWHRGL